MSGSFWIVVIECGALICVFAGAYLILLLRVWPRVFLRRYPKEIQKAVAPLNPRERAIGSVISLPFILCLLGFPLWASYRVASEGDTSFLHLFFASYLTWMIFNFFDWLVLDEFLIGFIQPSWLILPGTEGIPFTFNHSEHAMAFLKGSIGGVILSLLSAGVVPILLSA